METMTRPQLTQMSPLLLVADLDKSVAFYTGTLGFTVDFRYEDFYAGLRKDGFSIHLKSGDAPFVPAANRGQDPVLLFSVNGIDQLYSELSARATVVAQPLRTMPYGSEFYIADPDGNVVAFVEPME